MNAVTILIQSTAIMLVLMVFRPIFKRFLSARARCVLWMIPALRLLFPFELQSPLSIMTHIQPVSMGFENAVGRPVAVEVPAWLGSGIGLQRAGDVEASLQGAAAAAAGSSAISLGSVLFIIWLLGALITGGVIICQNVRFYSAVKRLSEPLGKSGGLPVYLVNGLPSPCLAGVLRPKIYINEHALVSEEVLGMTILHERTHYRRLDHIWGIVRGLLLALYWFHPLVWLCSELFRCDCEIACDEAATRGLDASQRESYGMTLIILAARGNNGSTGRFVCLSTMSGSKKLLKERITRLTKGRKLRSAALIAMMLAAVLCFTMCTVPESSDDDAAGPDHYAQPLKTQTVMDAPENVPAEIAVVTDTPRQEEFGSLEDMSYYLEMSVLNGSFSYMDNDRIGDILAEYGDLLDDYQLMGRVSADGKTYYIAGAYNGNFEDSPLYMMYSVELDGAAQLLYRESDSDEVGQILSTGQIPEVGYLLSDSHISYSSSSGLILIQPNDAGIILADTFSKYLYYPNGRAYIADAVSRGIAVNDTEGPYLCVYLISEQFGEISEKIPLTEAEADAILSEERLDITEGFGFCATLNYGNGETKYYTEQTGVPRSVIDLAVEKCGYKFGDPSYITGAILGATLECSWLTELLYADAAGLARLEEILKGAEFGYVGACGYGAKLTLELTGGEKLTVFKGTDDCGSLVFGSYGGYFISDEENTEFWQIFGLDPITKEPSV